MFETKCFWLSPSFLRTLSSYFSFSVIQCFLDLPIMMSQTKYFVYFVYFRWVSLHVSFQLEGTRPLSSILDGYTEMKDQKINTHLLMSERVAG